jgi:hypothetical protein
VNIWPIRDVCYEMLAENMPCVINIPWCLKFPEHGILIVLCRLNCKEVCVLYIAGF